MNKKFTFMVAALLAAGSFSANAAVSVIDDASQLENGKVYYIVSDGNDSNTLADDASDFALGVTSSTNWAAKNISVANTNDETFNVLGNTHQWIVSKNTNGTYSFTNVATKEKLAFTTGGILVATAEAKKTAIEANAYYTEFTASSGKFVAVGASTNTTITAESNNAIALDGNGNKLGFVALMNAPATAKDLQVKYGKTSLTFENVTDHAFKNITFVGAGASTDVKDMYLMVSGAPEAGYINTTDFATTYKDAEFVVLSNEKVTGDASSATSTGYKYKVVKGSVLAVSLAGNSSEGDNAGKIPYENAKFQVLTNSLKANQITLSQKTVCSIGEDKKWGSADDAVKVGIKSVGSTYSITSVETNADDLWATVGATAGEAVKVKDLVKGKMIVNVIATEANKTSFICALGVDGQFTADKEASEKILPTLGSQWYVSANADNTVTLINRDNNSVKIENITLFKNGEIYTATGSDVLVNRQLKLNVLETTMFDGFLKLDPQAQKTPYYLTTQDFALGGVTAYWAEGDNKAITAVAGEDAEKALEFKFDAVKKSGKEEIDTLMVATSYNYFDGETLKSAKDTVATFKYNLTAKNAKDASNNVLTSSYTLGSSAKEVVFKKVAEGKYQMAQPNTGLSVQTPAQVNTTNNTLTTSGGSAVNFSLLPVNTVSYNPNGSHFALELNGSYLGANADLNGIITSDTSLLKSTVADASFSFFAFSADKEEEFVPNYFLSTNGKMMYNPADSVKHYTDAIAEVGADKELKDKLQAELDKYYNAENSVNYVKFQAAKYAEAEKTVVVNGDTVSKDENLQHFKFNLIENENGTVSVKNGDKYVSVINSVAVLADNNTTEFTVVAAEAPTSNEGVSTSEVKVVAQNGSIVVKNAAGKNVVVSTILGQVVANEVLTSDNATINVPAGIVVVAVEGESFKVNVK